MKKRAKKILGIILLLAGLTSCSYGTYLFFQPSQFAATVKVRLDQDSEEWNRFLKKYHVWTQPPWWHDSTFYKKHFNLIRSPLVLSNVVIELNLTKTWGQKFNGGLLMEQPKVIKLINRHLKLSPVYNTLDVNIVFSSDNPIEAAQIANAIVKSYREYNLEQNKQSLAGQIKYLDGRMQYLENLIKSEQTNLDSQREKYKITEDNPNNATDEQVRFYWQPKFGLDKIKAEKIGTQANLDSSRLSLLEKDCGQGPIVHIIEPAAPPKTPINNTLLAACTILFGICFTIGGWLLLKPVPTH